MIKTSEISYYQKAGIREVGSTFIPYEIQPLLTLIIKPETQNWTKRTTKWTEHSVGM